MRRVKARQKREDVRPRDATRIAADATFDCNHFKLGEAAQGKAESEASESERGLARASTITLSIEDHRLRRGVGQGWQRLSCGCLALCHFHIVRRRRRYRETAEACLHFLRASVGPTDERPSVNRQSVVMPRLGSPRPTKCASPQSHLHSALFSTPTPTHLHLVSSHLAPSRLSTATTPATVRLGPDALSHRTFPRPTCTAILEGLHTSQTLAGPSPYLTVSRLQRP